MHESARVSKFKDEKLELLIFLQGHVEDVRRQVNEAVQSRHVSIFSSVYDFEFYQHFPPFQFSKGKKGRCY